MSPGRKTIASIFFVLLFSPTAKEAFEGIEGPLEDNGVTGQAAANIMLGGVTRQ